jgi:hypothetical protein
MRISPLNQIALAAAALLWVSCTAVAGTKLLRFPMCGMTGSSSAMRVIYGPWARTVEHVEELMKLLPAMPTGLPERPAPPIKTETP